MSPPPRYEFGPLERRGLIAGWRGSQIAVVGLGLLVALVALDSRSGPIGPVVAVAALGGSVAAACWPVGGRTADEWAPVVLHHYGDPRARRHRARVPLTGRRLDGAGEQGGEAMFAGLVVAAVQSSRSVVPSSRRPAAGQVGLVIDRRQRTYTAVLALRGTTFALTSAEDQQRAIARWSSVLADLARENSVLHRVQWVAVAVPDDGRAADGYLAERAVLPVGSAPRSSYTDLLASAGAASCRHEVLLAVQVRATAASARAIRAAGGGETGGCLVVLREAAALRRRLGETDVAVERVLGPDDLAQVIRRSWQDSPGGLEAAGGPGPRADPGADPADRASWPWPMAVEAGWGQVRTDATCHATYWIAEWPRLEVGPDFLAPLLLGTRRRTVSVVMEPVPPSRAIRQVQRARTADVADAELRRRGGFLASVRRSKEAETVVRREAELADGHASFRFSGYVTVTASTADELTSACSDTEQAAGQCRLELRRLYGDQSRALAYTLPLGRGLS